MPLIIVFCKIVTNWSLGGNSLMAEHFLEQLLSATLCTRCYLARAQGQAGGFPREHLLTPLCAHHPEQTGQ